MAPIRAMRKPPCDFNELAPFEFPGAVVVVAAALEVAAAEAELAAAEEELAAAELLTAAVDWLEDALALDTLFALERDADTEENAEESDEAALPVAVIEPV